jgi:hypothetical protein
MNALELFAGLSVNIRHSVIGQWFCRMLLLDLPGRRLAGVKLLPVSEKPSAGWRFQPRLPQYNIGVWCHRSKQLECSGLMISIALAMKFARDF